MIPYIELYYEFNNDEFIFHPHEYDLAKAIKDLNINIYDENKANECLEKLKMYFYEVAYIAYLNMKG